MDSQVVGPAYQEMPTKYHGDASAPDKPLTKLRNGGTFAWGRSPHAAEPGISDADRHTVIAWILSSAPDK
jgi:cytochrome c